MTFTGDGGHAGGQLMAVRNDAGLAAAELALHVEAATLATGAGAAARCAALWKEMLGMITFGRNRGQSVSEQFQRFDACKSSVADYLCHLHPCCGSMQSSSSPGTITTWQGALRTLITSRQEQQ